MVAGLLEQVGIAAQVRGDLLQGAVGELPAAGLASVWVDNDDESRAREVVADYEQQQQAEELMSSRSREPSASWPGAFGRGLILGMVVGVLLGLLVGSARAASSPVMLVGTVAHIPGLANPDLSGPFIDLLVAMDDALPAVSLQIRVAPFVRSIHDASTGRADFHLPMIRNPSLDLPSLPWRYVERPMGKVCMVLYSAREAPLTAAQASRGAEQGALRVATLSANLDLFALPLEGITELRQGLGLVARGRLDGFIGAQEETDSMLRASGLKNIHRSLFHCYDDVLIVPKGAAGDRTAALLEEALDALEAQGRLAPLHGRVHQPYQDWQPY